MIDFNKSFVMVSYQRLRHQQLTVIASIDSKGKKIGIAIKLSLHSILTVLTIIGKKAFITWYS